MPPRSPGVRLRPLGHPSKSGRLQPGQNGGGGIRTHETLPGQRLSRARSNPVGLCILEGMLGRVLERRRAPALHACPRTPGIPNPSVFLSIFHNPRDSFSDHPRGLGLSTCSVGWTGQCSRIGPVSSQRAYQFLLLVPSRSYNWSTSFSDRPCRTNTTFS